MTSDPRTPRRARRAAGRQHVGRLHVGRLHVGTDAEKTIVGSYPLRMRTGRATRRRWGVITEVTPAVPSGRGRDERTRLLSQLALGLLVLSALVSAAGIAWWVCAAGAVALLAAVTRAQARTAAAGVLALPRGLDGEDAPHVLHAAEERVAFARAFTVAKRVQRTWPALRHMIDAPDAERMLSRALRDLAGVLSRRQQIRRLRAELAGVDHRGLPADSPAVAALLAQQVRVDELWREAGAEANRHLVALSAAATAGEDLIREQLVGRTARDAEHAIARLTAPVGVGPSPGPDAGQELAERTAAVVDAYRDLAARYGAGV